jgi:hypothetical protein
LAVDRTISLPAESDGAVDPVSVESVESDVAVVDESAPKLTDTTGAVAEVVGADAEAETQHQPKAPAAADVSDNATEPAAPPKKPVDTTPVKDAPKAADETVKKVTAGPEKDPGAKDDAGTAAAKPASDSGDK